MLLFQQTNFTRNRKNFRFQPSKLHDSSVATCTRSSARALPYPSNENKQFLDEQLSQTETRWSTLLYATRYQILHRRYRYLGRCKFTNLAVGVQELGHDVSADTEARLRVVQISFRCVVRPCSVSPDLKKTRKLKSWISGLFKLIVIHMLSSIFHLSVDVIIFVWICLS